MADPLSVAASIIGVVGAVRVTIKSLERLVALKDAPTLIKQLSSEVCRYQPFLINRVELIFDRRSPKLRFSYKLLRPQQAATIACMIQKVLKALPQ